MCPCFFSAKQAALMRNGKDWLDRNQDNVSELNDMFTVQNVASVS